MFTATKLVVAYINHLGIPIRVVWIYPYPARPAAAPPHAALHEAFMQISAESVSKARPKYYASQRQIKCTN